MKIVIENTEYTKIGRLSFAPETDLTGNSAPINEFTADIITDDIPPVGVWAYLYDDMDTLWAKYWLEDRYRINADTVRVFAVSPLALMDRVILPPVMYVNAWVSDVFDDIFENQGYIDFTMDSIFASAQINGWCPEQTARERLQWVCFVIGAYLKTFFSDRIWALQVDTTDTLIPMGDIYWKPQMSVRDTVTAIKATVYSFTQGTPQVTDEYVTNGMEWYIVTKTEVTVTNPNVTAGTPENVISVDGITLINSGNVSTVLTHLSTYFFNRDEVEVDVINNGTYMPGDRVTASLDDETMVKGYINSASFTFGLQAKSRIRLTALVSVEATVLTITYTYNGSQIGLEKYVFPVGFGYDIPNKYIDQEANGHRYIYRPLTERTTGTMESGENLETVDNAIALDLFEGVLHIISVDEVEEVSSGPEGEEITIGVIT